MKFQDRVTIKVIAFTLISLFAIPYYFLAGGTLLGFILIRLVSMFFGFCSQIGWHRWLTHNSFQPTKLGRYLMYFGMLSTGIGRPIELVVAHRFHHVNPDTEQDPHSPKYISFFRMWLGRYKGISKPVPPRDILRNNEVMWFNNHYWLLFWIVNFTLCLIDFKSALIFIPVSVAYSWFIVTLVNYYGHKNPTGEIASRNTGPVLAFITGGEGLHKNHHDHPTSSNLGTNNEFDIGYWIVKRFLRAQLST